MNKLPTPKQVRFHYKRMRRRWYLLQEALNDAHNANVIAYPEEKYHELGPCASNWQTRERIEFTTKEARAKAIHDEVLNELKGVY